MLQSKTAGESDSEREDMELSEISKVLEKHDPSFNKLAMHDLCMPYTVFTLIERKLKTFSAIFW